MRFEIPYGHTHLDLVLPNQSVRGVLVPKTEQLARPCSGDDIVKESLRSPIGSPPLRELAAGRKSAVIIVSDHTRPVPSQHIIPWMLAELREINPDIDVTLLVATGFHRKTTHQELVNKLGPILVRNERIIIHDCQDKSSICNLGFLPSGEMLAVNRTAVETDLLLAEGFIEPHFFAGFSGGRKSVLPGICDRITVLGNHCGKFIDSPSARAGILDGNPIHQDMMIAARMAKLAFIVNVIIDEQKNIVASFAGDPIFAHRCGCDFLKQYCQVKSVPADIVITSNGGAPLDQNIYQAVKGLCTAEASAAENGVIIICAECQDGTGSEDLLRALRDCESPGILYDRIKQIPMTETEPDQWEYQILARILTKHKVVFVTRPELQTVISDMKMLYAANLDEALNIARRLKGQDAGVTVIPNGISVIVE